MTIMIVHGMIIMGLLLSTKLIPQILFHDISGAISMTTFLAEQSKLV